MTPLAAVDLYAAGLYAVGQDSYNARQWRVRHEDGSTAALELGRWTSRLWAGDEALLDRCIGPVLDVGCGPGRLTGALAASGVSVLGIDVTPAAVAAARRAGVPVARCDVFRDVPAVGCWRTAVLADGNVGIGGDPVRLLRRVGALLGAHADVLCELDPPGAITRQVRARLEGTRGRVSRWFDWAYVGVDDITTLAEAACLRHTATWQKAGRWFVTLTT